MSMAALIIFIAIVGATLLWLERNDTEEKLGPVKMGSGKWTMLILVLAAALVREHHVELWRFALAFALIAWAVTAPHNLLLKPAGIQIVTAPRDGLQWLVLKTFSKERGDVLGWPACVVYSIFRYGAPISGAGFAVDSFAVVAAGPVASLMYLPWRDGDRFKIQRATAFGLMLFGALSFDLR